MKVETGQMKMKRKESAIRCSSKNNRTIRCMEKMYISRREIYKRMRERMHARDDSENAGGIKLRNEVVLNGRCVRVGKQMEGIYK